MAIWLDISKGVGIVTCVLQIICESIIYYRYALVGAACNFDINFNLQIIVKFPH